MANIGNILLIDDDQTVLNILRRVLEGMSYCVETASSGEEGLNKFLNDSSFDLVLLDQELPGIKGVETILEINKISSEAQIIVITAYATVSEAISALKHGAYDYLMKPIEPQSLVLAIERAMEVVRLNRELKRYKKILLKENRSGGIITKNRLMLEILGKINTIARIDSTVMISGESGTGKELFARAIHANSPRAKGPFIPVNCAAFTEELLGSSLFGFNKGAFTGAMQTTKGCLEEAAGGVLFLDEVGEMSPRLQSSLLRALQEKEFCRLGSYEPIKTDIRLITASNKDLKDEVAARNFREDLYFRLNVIPIHLPPLRERKDDIELLAYFFLEKYNIVMKKNVGPILPEVVKKLKNYFWQGNCRELENVIEHIVAVKEDGPIELYDLTENLRSYIAKTMIKNDDEDDIRSFADEKFLFEKQYLERALDKCNGNISRLSRLASLSRPVLYEKLKKHGLK